MLRREFLAFLGGLPFLNSLKLKQDVGSHKAENKHSYFNLYDHATNTYLRYLAYPVESLITIVLNGREYQLVGFNASDSFMREINEWPTTRLVRELGLVEGDFDRKLRPLKDRFDVYGKPLKQPREISFRLYQVTQLS